jgi:hypothetical protein
MSSSVSLVRRMPSGAARAPRRREARLSALPDQAALEFRQRAKDVKNQPRLRGRRVEGFSPAAKPDAPHPKAPSRSSFHTISVSPLLANSRASCKAGRSVTAPDICSVKILWHPASVSASRCKARFCSPSKPGHSQSASVSTGLDRHRVVLTISLARSSPHRDVVDFPAQSCERSLPFNRHKFSRNSTASLPLSRLKKGMRF